MHMLTAQDPRVFTHNIYMQASNSDKEVFHAHAPHAAFAVHAIFCDRYLKEPLSSCLDRCTKIIINYYS